MYPTRSITMKCAIRYEMRNSVDGVNVNGRPGSACAVQCPGLRTPCIEGRAMIARTRGPCTPSHTEIAGLSSQKSALNSGMRSGVLAEPCSTSGTPFVALQRCA